MKKNLFFLLMVFFLEAAPSMADLYVGSNASGVNVTNSTSTNYTNVVIGYGAGSDNNSLTVNSGSTLQATNLYVCYDGTNNSLIVSGSGSKMVAHSNVYLGYNSDSSGGNIIVTNSASLTNNGSNSYFGYNGPSNNVLLSNGATSTVINASIGYNSSSSNNQVTITGSSAWNSTNLTIGGNGASNSVTVSGSGSSIRVHDYVYLGSNSSSNSLTVNNGAVMTNTGSTNYYGYQGGNNTFVVSNGSIASDELAFVGFSNTSSNNTVKVASNSTWSNSTSLYIGYEGAGNTVLVSNSSTLINYGTNYIGGTVYNASNSVSSNNAITVTTSSHWTNHGPMYILSSGNHLNVLDNSTVTNGSDFHIYYGSNNTVTISGDSLLVNNWAFIGGTNNNDLASTSSSNTINVSTGLWYNYGNLYLLGNTNQINLTGGSYVYVQDNSYIGSTNTNSQGNIVTINGSTWSNGGDVFVGWTNDSYTSTASLIITNGGQLNANSLYVYHGGLYVSGNTNALGTNMTLTLGTNNNSSAQLYLSSGGTTSLNLKGLNIGSNASIYNINPNHQVLHISGELHNTNTNNVCRIYLSDTLSLDNNQDLLMSYGVINGFNENIYSNISIQNFLGYNLITNSTNLYLQILTDANLNVSQNILQTSSVTVNSLTYGYGTATISSTGEIIVVSDIVFGSGATLSNDGVIISEGAINIAPTNNGDVTIINNKTINDINGYISPGNGYSVSVTLSGSSSVWSNLDNFYFGNGSSSANTLIIEDGATLRASDFIASNSVNTNTLSINDGFLIGTNFILASLNNTFFSNQSQITFNDGVIGTNGSNNNLTISGTGTIATFNEYLVIGSLNSTNNTVTVQSGGELEAGNIVLGDGTNSSGNTLIINGSTVTATNTNLADTNVYRVIVGYSGTDNNLVITNGGVLSNSLGAIGYSPTSSNNSALIADSNSSWISTTSFYVGFSSSSNSLLISNGGSVLVKGLYSYIGLNSTNNIATVTGSNSLFSNEGTLNIGYFGSSNTLVISGGATVIDSSISGTNFASSFAAILGAYSNNNAAVVEDNSTWINNGNLAVGFYGNSNSITNNSGTISAVDLYVGYYGRGNSAFFGGGTSSFSSTIVGYGTGDFSNNIVVQSNAVWTNSGDVTVGYSGSGNGVTINGSTNVSSANTYIGYNSNSSNNNVTLTNNSLWENSQNLYVGYSGGSNNLAIQGGSQVTCSNTYVSSEVGSFSNSITITGSGSLLSNSGTITVGGSNSSGSITINSDATVIAQSLSIIGGSVTLGNSNSLSSMPVQIGGGSQAGELKLATSATISSLNWQSNGFISLQPGGQTLTVTGAITTSTNGGGGGFDFSGISLNNNTNPLIAYESTSLALDDYYVTGVSGYTFLTNSNSVSGYFATNANVTFSVNLNQTNAVTLGNLTLTSNAVATIASSGSLLLLSNLVITNSATLNNEGYVQVDGSLFNYTNGIINNGSTNSTIDVEKNLTNFYHITNFGIIVAANFYNNNNEAYVTNAFGANINIETNFYNYGTLYNDGEIRAGDFYNYGTLRGSGTITVTNTNTFHQDGMIILDGTTIINGNVVAGKDSVIDAQSEGAVLKINGTFKSDGDTVILNFSGGSIHNDTNTILDCGEIDTTNFEVKGQTGATLLVDSTRVRSFYETNADVTSETDIYQTNEARIKSLVLESNATLALDSNADLTVSSDMTVTKDAIVSNSGGKMDIEGNYTNYNRLINSDAGIINVHGDYVAGSKSVLSSSDSQLHIDNELKALNHELIIDIDGTSLHNDSQTIVTYQGTDVTNILTPNIDGLTTKIGSNAISVYAETNANITSRMNTHQTNDLTVNSCDLEGGAKMLIETNVVVNASSNMKVEEDATFINKGDLKANELDIYGTFENKGTAEIGDVYNHGLLIMNGESYLNLTHINTLHQEGTMQLLPGTTTTSGNVIQGSNAVIIDDILGTSSGQYGQLVINNGSLILNGFLNLNFIFKNKPNQYYGQRLKDIFVAQNGIFGNFKEVISTLPDVAGTLVLNDNGTKADVLLFPSSYALVAQDANQTNVAIALNSFMSATNGDQRTVFIALDELTASEYPAAFEAIMPLLYQSLSTIAFNLANAQNNELIQRLWSLRVTGSGFSMNGFGDNMPLLQDQERDKMRKEDILIPGPDKHWGVFVDGNGIFAQANSGNMLPSYNAESGGVTVGLSYQWNKHFLSGLYSGYEGSSTKYDGATPGILVDNAVRFGLFESYGEPDGKGFYLNSLFGGAYNNYNMQRTITFSTLDRTATGTPGAGELDTMLASGYDIKKNNWTFGPTTSLQYTYLGVNPFNETGAQSLNLNANGWNTSSMVYSLGSHVAYNWQVNKNLLLTPQVSLSWQHEFLQSPYAINSNLNGSGSSFATWSSTPQRDTFFPSCSIMVNFGDRWDSSLSYSAVAGNQDIKSQNIFWSFGIKF